MVARYRVEGSTDGAAWQPLGAGMNDAVAALAAWDGDGEGGAPPVLAAGGAFTSAGGAPVIETAASRAR